MHDQENTASPSDVELVETSEVELRVGTTSIEVTKGSSVSKINFSDIVRTFIEVNYPYVQHE